MCRNRLTLVILSLLFFNIAFAQSLQQAAKLLDEGQYETAYKIYVALAQANDPVAQYNLGLMFKNGLGREASPEQASFWFQQAAKQGIAEAYNQLQNKAIASAAGTHIRLEYGPEEWVKIQKDTHYTLQLASSTNKKLIEKYYNENQLRGKAGYYRNQRKGEDWYALVYGSYPSINEANEAVSSLPENLRKWSPWVRKVKDIQRLMKE
ncbi:MAG: SPOR domain-containing protein [Gammaproteobacteria bacterium]|jgi:TPR repeat protein